MNTLRGTCRVCKYALQWGTYGKLTVTAYSTVTLEKRTVAQLANK